MGAFAASCCLKAEGLKIDMSTSALCSQDVENKPAPKSETEAVSAQHCAGCNWPGEAQIWLFKLLHGANSYRISKFKLFVRQTS